MLAIRSQWAPRLAKYNWKSHPSAANLLTTGHRTPEPRGAALASSKEQRAVEDAYDKLGPRTMAVKKCGRGSQTKTSQGLQIRFVSSFMHCHLA